MSSIQYYDHFAQDFYDRTINSDVSRFYKKFLEVIPKGAKILEAGCGSGRDVKYFSSLEFDVTAFDGSIELVKKAREFTGQEIHHLLFKDINFHDQFDAVWAQASLLHVPYNELRDVFEKLHRSLKKEGIFFASFKYGNQERQAGERTFYDMDEKAILPYLKDLFDPIDIWKTDDTRSKVAASPAKAWLNVLCKSI